MGDPKPSGIDKHKSIHARGKVALQEKQVRAMIEDAQRASDLKNQVLDSFKDMTTHAISLMRDEVSDAETYFLAIYGSLMGGLAMAGTDFGNVTKETDKPISGAILDALLLLASIATASPEIEAFAGAARAARDAARQSIIPLQLGAQSNELLDRAKSAPYVAEAALMSQTRELASQLDEVLVYALGTISEVRKLITAYESQPGNTALPNSIRLKMGALKIKRGIKDLTFQVNTPFYADAMLFDLLKVYAQKYVVLEWFETADTRSIWGPATIDNPALDDGIGVRLRGMDGRELAYEHLGSRSPFNLRLRKTGRPAVDSFRDIVKVWGARVKPTYMMGPAEAAIAGTAELIDSGLAVLKKDIAR